MYKFHSFRLGLVPVNEDDLDTDTEETESKEESTDQEGEGKEWLDHDDEEGVAGSADDQILTISGLEGQVVIMSLYYGADARSDTLYKLTVQEEAN